IRRLEEGAPGSVRVKDARRDRLALVEDPELVLLVGGEHRELSGHDDASLGGLAPEDAGPRLRLRIFAAQAEDPDRLPLQDTPVELLPRPLDLRGPELFAPDLQVPRPRP